MTVEIIDIGMGNIYSIQNLLYKLNIDAKIITTVEQIKSDFLILPGVGSAKLYMEKLQQSKFDKAIIKHIKANKRLLGICLGFQILGEYSQEDGGVQGLGLLKGYTSKLGNNISNNQWINFHLKKQNLIESKWLPQAKLSRKQSIDGRVFYNHEYGFVCEDKNVYSQSISLGLDKYSSIVIDKNIIGVQFHPEKSQTMGIELLGMVL